MRPFVSAVCLALAALTVPASSDAFCGFYVAGADQKLFNNATMVVMMREGTRTVLSMANNYQGPPEDFAMIVPVPVVLQKENVKTLSAAIFDKVDQLAAPRLVEYWEQDPCVTDSRLESAVARPSPRPGAAAPRAARESSDLGVTIEAQFEVGEYQIVILSATDSTGLETWLKQEKYKIPDGAEPLLRPYVQGGSKFFVAKVDTKKVSFDKGMAKLSPLRFHYDTETFSLPVRLGLINSNGKQDLIVHILARNARYELANYKNVTIPTNLDVDEGARGQFGAFYAALFDRTIEENPGAIVTEYAWDASTCDPCPGPSLSSTDFATLGMDVLPAASEDDNVNPPPAVTVPTQPTQSPFLKTTPPAGAERAKPATNSPIPPPGRSPRPRWRSNGFVLTRLHARYGADALGEDLVFRKAGPLVGGREFLVEVVTTKAHDHTERRLETGSRAANVNNFQGRYAIRHPWKGEITCQNPRRGVWGGPPEGTPRSQTAVAKDLAFAPRDGIKLASFIRHDVPEIKLKGAPTTLAAIAFAGATPASETTSNAAPTPSAQSGAPGPAAKSGCGACDVGQQESKNAFGVFAGIALAIASVGRRIRRRAE